MTRLPVPGGDNGDWGQVLNDFLDVEHANDGSLKIRTDGTLSGFAHNSDLAGKISSSIATAKGDLVVATSASTVTRLAVGSDAQVLAADSTQATGVKWATAKGVSPLFNVKDYGATGNGTTDDTAAINAAVAAATVAGGGVVFVPAGTYIVSGTVALAANITLEGAGRGTATIKRSTNVTVVSIYGTSTGNHVTNVAIRNLTIHGNDSSATAVDVVYASSVHLMDLQINSTLGIGLDLVEVWDSRFINIDMVFSGGLTTGNAALMVRSSRAASGFGSSTDNINECYFWGTHMEHFRAGAIRIEPGVNATGGPNGIYFSDLKMESPFVADGATALYLDAATDRIFIDKVYMYIPDLLSGSPIVGIQWNSDGVTSLRDVFIGNDVVNTFTKGVDLGVFGDNTCVVENITGNYATSPSIAHVNVSQGNSYTLRDIRSNAAVNLSGVGDDTVQNLAPIKAVAGAVSDASFAVSPPIGTMAVDISGNQLYVKTAASTWKKVTVA